MNGLVIETGHQQTAITPIVEGHIIEKGVYNYPINGFVITEQIHKNLKKLNSEVLTQIPLNEQINWCIDYKHKHKKIDLNTKIPKVGFLDQEIEFEKHKYKIQLEEVFQNSLNMYFNPSDFETNIGKSLSDYIA